MSEILIHRCRLRLVRRGGWSWGADPRALLQAAVRAFPALLAAALEDLWPEADEREIAAPVRLRVRVPPGELIEALAGVSADGRPQAGSPAAELARCLAAALAQALPGELSPVRRGIEGSAAPGSHGTPDDLETVESLRAGLSLGRLLRAWRDRGSLASRLALLSGPVLEAWRAALLREAAEEGRAGAPWSAEAAERLRREVEALGAPPWTQAAERATALRIWLTTAVEIAARCGIETGAAARACVLEGPPADVAPPGPHSPRPSAGSPSVRPAVWRDTEIHVASALPFLLLGPLSRIGYLETLAAVFAAAGLAGDLPLFATALAYKVLPPPERGWRRLPAAMEAAAACAGLLDPVSDSDLTDLARRASPCLEPLAADLALSLLAGHEPGRPLLLAAAGEGLLLAEADGVFPIAWWDGPSPPEIGIHTETLLVSADAATPALLRELDEKGIRFVTAVPPTRGEPWRPLRLPDAAGGHRAWTNDPAAPGLARQASGLAVAEDGARRLWQALAVERPSAPRAAGSALDRHLTLAAGVALGTLAWTLWRDREPVDPVLALERFGDLDARVRFRARSIHVLLPLGRRHQDLFRHRLLEPVRDAAWLGGRVLEFGGG